MAPSAADSQTIYDAVKQSGVMLSVCHGLRYTPYNRKLKELIDSGLIGQVRNIDLVEPVGYWHQAHSFVRGNWRNSVESSPMLLAKSCHDLDFLNFLLPARCTKVASFGSLSYFTRANQPAGAADRCTECPEAIESKCAYSAQKIYLRDRATQLDGWPVSVVSSSGTAEGVRQALAEGPYGRCVFACDNDVVDHQVVILECEDGAVATFAMSAFNKHTGRETYVMGDQGVLRCVDTQLTHYDFLTNEERVVDYNTGLIDSGHGGGDFGLMRDFVAAVRENDPSRISSGPEVSLESHLIVFAAERARRTGSVVAL
jgi:predicted dehydrogenase